MILYACLKARNEIQYSNRSAKISTTKFRLNEGKKNAPRKDQTNDAKKNRDPPDLPMSLLGLQLHLENETRLATGPLPRLSAQRLAVRRSGQGGRSANFARNDGRRRACRMNVNFGGLGITLSTHDYLLGLDQRIGRILATHKLPTQAADELMDITDELRRAAWALAKKKREPNKELHKK